MSNIKDHFVSRFGDEGLLIEFDCKLLEVCAQAEIWKDPVLIEELNSGVDIHHQNAVMWKGAGTTITKAIRRAAKTLTFQLIYGSGAKNMAKQADVSVEEAKSFITRYFDKYHRNSRVVSALKDGISMVSSEIEPLNKTSVIPIQTPTHRAYFAGVYRSNYTGKWGPSLPQMQNYPLQGFATGDVVPFIINMVMLELEEVQDKILFCNTIHDSAVFDTKDIYLVRLLQAIEKVFTDFPKEFKEVFDYELQVNYNYTVKIGANWAEMIEYSRPEIQDMIGDK